MTSIQLIQRPVKVGDKRIAYWQLRWNGTDGKPQTESLGRAGVIGKDKDGKRIVRACKGDMTRTDAEDIRTKRMIAVGSGKVRIDRPKDMAFTAFIDEYKTRRRAGDAGRGFLRGSPRLSESTIIEHAMTLRYLVQHFGADRRLTSITQRDAEEWITALQAGGLTAARKESKQTYGMGEQTIRKHIRNAKAVFNWAYQFNYVNANPFENFDAKPRPSDANPYIAAEDIGKVIDKALSIRWKILFALCRHAGLRLGEVLALPWSGNAVDREDKTHWIGVDWENRRICLVAQKTRCYRVVPMSPVLHDLLAEAFAAAQDGDNLVCGLGRNNLRKRGRTLVKRAGLAPWRKLYQSLRSSCENDWKQRGIAEATYCTWLGHSPQVSRNHYVSPTDAEYERVTKAA